MTEIAVSSVLSYGGQHWALLLGVVLLGLGVGMVTALFGAGGGVVLTPVLNVVINVPMQIAVGTSAAQVLGASSFAMWQQVDRRFLGIRVAVAVGLTVPVGSYLGTQVVEWAKGLGIITVLSRPVLAVDFILLLVFSVFLSLLAAWLVVDNFWLRRGAVDDEDNHRGFLAAIRIPPLIHARTIPAGAFSAPLLLGLGLFVGFLSGLLGIGGGVIMMPMLFYVVGQTTKFATQTSLMVGFVAGLSSTINHAMEGNVDAWLAGSLILGAFVGTQIGTVIRSKVSGKSIRQYFALVILGVLLMVVCKLYGMLTA